MEKIRMTTPLVELDGDEMTRIIWRAIKDKLIAPFLELKTEYYDLGLPNRELTHDEVTKSAAFAIKKYGVGVKCATITPNEQRMSEYNLSQKWRSPNGTIRGILDGTVFREPILVDGIKPLIASWEKPIIIARHAYGDVYSAVESVVCEGTPCYLKVGDEQYLIHDFSGSSGVVQCMHNRSTSIVSFAVSCFEYAYAKGVDLWFSAKDTISKKYDETFKQIFQEIYETKYKKKFAEKKISYFYTLIDDAVARILRSQGGMLWACKNYDGDVMSDMLATAFGSLAMMTSVLLSPDGAYEYEAAHGTVTRHYYKYLEGEQTSTNPVATIFAWTGALKKRGELDNNVELINFAESLQKATISTIEDGFMTGDLVSLFDNPGVVPVKLSTNDFLDKVADYLKKELFR